jgi:DNA-binding transcriptional MerR regulator
VTTTTPEASHTRDKIHRTLLTVGEAAQEIGISGYTLTPWARRGLVPAIRLQGENGRRSRIYFRRADVARVATPRRLNEGGSK